MATKRIPQLLETTTLADADELLLRDNSNGDDRRVTVANMKKTFLSAADADRVANSPYCTDSGAADAYVLSVNYAGAAPSGLNDGDQFRFRAANANTGASTINVDGAGAKSCVTVTFETLPAGYIRTDADTLITYEAANDRFVVDRVPEYVSNAQGDAVKYADGLVIQHGEFTSSQSWQASGSIYRSATPHTWSLPVTMVARSSKQWHQSADTENPNCWATAVGAMDETQVAAHIYSGLSGLANSQTLTFNAVGYWY